MANKKIVDVVFQHTPTNDPEEQYIVDVNRAWLPSPYSRVRRETNRYFLDGPVAYSRWMNCFGAVFGEWLVSKVEYGRWVSMDDLLVD